MLLLRNSFSHKRKDAKRPRDLHIRKVSFSGSSVSACSLSSSDSTASACTAFRSPVSPSSYNYTTAGATRLAPPRLHERPLKSSGPSSSGSSCASRRCRSSFVMSSASTAVYGDDDYYDDDIDADYCYGDDCFAHMPADVDDVPVLSSDDDDSSEHDSDDGDDGMSISDFVMAMPPHAPAETSQESSAAVASEDGGYFAAFRNMPSRPPMPRSRWSESTISSMASTAVSEADDEPVFDDEATPVDEAPRRPPMKQMDEIDDFVKRGGWKRRGIVFQREDMHSF